MCVHSSITPFMKHRDSLCSEWRWPVPHVMFLACSMSKWGPLLLTADSIWSSPSLSLRPISRVESEAWRPGLGWEHDAEVRNPIWSLSGERRLNRSRAKSSSERLSKLPGAFFTKSWPIRKESVWKSKAWRRVTVRVKNAAPLSCDLKNSVFLKTFNFFKLTPQYSSMLMISSSYTECAAYCFSSSLQFTARLKTPCGQAEIYIKLLIRGWDTWPSQSHEWTMAFVLTCCDGSQSTYRNEDVVVKYIYSSVA